MDSLEQIDKIIKEMYAQVSFERGERPDWKRQHEIFAPGARMVRINDDGVFEFTLDSYERDFEKMIDSGAMPSFWEAEIWRDTYILDNMAHVLSAYEARRTRGGEVLNRGVNSIQLFRRDGRWWISAMIWRREGAHVRVPDKKS